MTCLFSFTGSYLMNRSCLAAQLPHLKEICEELCNTKACLRTLNSTQAGLIACFAFLLYIIFRREHIAIIEGNVGNLDFDLFISNIKIHECFVVREHFV